MVQRPSFIEEYSEKHIHFFNLDLPKMLEGLLMIYNKLGRKFSLIDLGCGDGRLLYALYYRGLLKKAYKVVGVDISQKRIKRLEKYLPIVKGIVADVQDLKKIPKNSFDIVISEQVIEHVPDESKMLNEIYRIIKRDGHLYISSVLKKKYGMWFYYNHKRGFILDPTHLREYSSEKDFVDILVKHGFIIKKINIRKLNYKLIDLTLRALNRFGILELSPDYYLVHKKLRKLDKFKISIVGYNIIEVLATPDK